MLLMTGGADDWTPATADMRACCARRSRRASADARFRLEIYPGAYHGFSTAPASCGCGAMCPMARVPAGACTEGGDPVARGAALAQLDSWLASPNP
ncbi:hypothetical protein ACU4GD_09135 [Cupriavidus basilensis]